MRIRVRCNTCGAESELRPQQIDLEVLERSARPAGRYTFDCPACGMRVERRADERAMKLLEAGGVSRRPPQVHPEHPPAGPPLRIDDLIDLHLLLNREDWFESLARSVGRA